MNKKNVWREDNNTRFYRYSSIIALVIVLIGFYTTYTKPVILGNYSGPSWGHLHGGLALIWLVLTIVQSHLARSRMHYHRLLGISAVIIMPAWVISSIIISREAALMTVESGDLMRAQINILGGIVSSVIVMMLAFAALFLRRSPQWHKRLIFLATVLILWPAWARWRHYFPNPEALLNFFAFFVALSPIAIAAFRDRLLFGAVHPAYIYVGPAIVVEQVLEIMFLGDPACLAVCGPVFELLT